MLFTFFLLYDDSELFEECAGFSLMLLCLSELDVLIEGLEDGVFTILTVLFGASVGLAAIGIIGTIVVVLELELEIYFLFANVSNKDSTNEFVFDSRNTSRSLIQRSRDD